MDAINLVAIIAATLSIVSLAFTVKGQKDLKREIIDLKKEQDAINQASFGLARNIRHQQSDPQGKSKDSFEAKSHGGHGNDRSSSRDNTSFYFDDEVDLTAKQHRKTSRRTSNENRTLAQADRLMDGGADTLKLADELGLSQNEAEIISHLRPNRRYAA